MKLEVGDCVHFAFLAHPVMQAFGIRKVERMSHDRSARDIWVGALRSKIS